MWLHLWECDCTCGSVTPSLGVWLHLWECDWTGGSVIPSVGVWLHPYECHCARGSVTAPMGVWLHLWECDCTCGSLTAPVVPAPYREMRGKTRRVSLKAAAVEIQETFPQKSRWKETKNLSSDFYHTKWYCVVSHTHGLTHRFLKHKNQWLKKTQDRW